MSEPRLGDIIDDFCIKCKRLTNHQVVSMLGPEPAKVRCRTCYSDHDYRHEQAPPPKVDPRKAALFNAVLEKMPPPPEVPALDIPAIDVPAVEIPAVEVPAKAKRKAKA
jgi:hypothetical protein